MLVFLEDSQGFFSIIIVLEKVSEVMVSCDNDSSVVIDCTKKFVSIAISCSWLSYDESKLKCLMYKDNLIAVKDLIILHLLIYTVNIKSIL